MPPRRPALGCRTASADRDIPTLADKGTWIRLQFPPPDRPDRQPPNRGLVAWVAGELRCRAGRWAYLPNWVFWPTVRRLVDNGDTFDEAWAWARQRMVTARGEAQVPAIDVGPCLLWEPPPRPVRRPAWVPAPATLGELRAKPGQWARVHTFDKPTGAANPASLVKRGKVDLDPAEWDAVARQVGTGSGLWLRYDRRRQVIDVETDRRRST